MVLKEILLALLFLSSSLWGQEYYQIKKINQPPEIVIVKELNSVRVIVEDKDKKTIEIKMSDLEWAKEYTPNADRLYNKIILFANNKYIQGTIISQTVKKITIEIDGKDLKVFKTNTIDDIVGIEEFWRERNKTKEKAMYYSLIFPGWGQSYGNQGKLKTFLFPIAFFSLFGMGISSYAQSEKAYDEYQNSFFLNQNAYQNHVSLANRSNLLFLGAIGVWSYSVFDAYFFFSPTYTHERMEIKFEKKF